MRMRVGGTIKDITHDTNEKSGRTNDENELSLIDLDLRIRNCLT